MSQLPNTKLLHAFEATARHGSITMAAEELFITQSALSRQIKSLEDLLKLELFTRQKNRLILTDAGKMLYTVLDKSLREIASCTANIQKGLRRIMIKAPPSFATYWLAPRLAQFYSRHQCLISLHTESLSSAMVQNYDCEILFRYGNSPFSHATVLLDEQIQPACSPVLLEQINKNGIDSVPVLHTLSGITPLPYWDFWTAANPGSRYAPSSISIMAGMEFSAQEQAINAAIEGLGVVMVDINIASQALKKGQLVAVGEEVSTPFGYWLVENGLESDKSEIVKSFCHWIKEETLVCRT
jgi:LysR family glycine cleavage system transcriptional activator